MNILWCCILIIGYIVVAQHSCEAAKILIVLPTSFSSHFTLLKSVVDVLATEHNITFYSYNPGNINHENVTEKRVINDYHLKSNNKINKFMEVVKLDIYLHQVYFLDYFGKNSESMLAGNDIKELINSTEKYDLFITTHLYSEAVFKLSDVLKVPLIQVSTSIPFPWTMDAIGIRYNLGYDASFITNEEPNSFIQRIKKFVKHIYVWLYYDWFYLPQLERMSKKYFPPETRTIKEISRNTGGVLINVLSPMGLSINTNVMDIGGLHLKPIKSLPENLEEYVANSGDHGVIYFSLGTTVPEVAISPKIWKNILDVFKTLPQRILWKSDKEIENLPDNVKVSKWFPQQDILGHNKTKLFITQGGMLSSQEAVYHGIPVIVFPLITDQFVNGQTAERNGYGKMMFFQNFKTNDFLNYIQELINNPKYKENAKLMSSIIKNQPISNAEKLKHWVNFKIKQINSTVFQSPTDNLSQFELLELDVISSIIVTIIFLILCFICIFLYTLKVSLRSFQCKLKIKKKIE